MSCHRFQIDLSRCLDGRLPGARRAEVMAHLDQCPKCEQVWADIQAAQSIVFRLDQPRVGPSFREQVWERIHSGEGAPEVLLQEPITNWFKVRYGLVGAAAAAAFLFTLHLVFSDDAPVTNGPENDVADNRLPFDQPLTNPFGSATLAASHVAHATAQKVTTAARRLRSRRDRILHGGPLDRPLRREVDQYVGIIDGGLQVLDRLQRREFVSFEPSSRDCLISVRNSLSLDSDPVKRSYNLVRTLSDCSLDGLDKQLKYTISFRQIAVESQVLFDMLAEPRLRHILTRLEVLHNRGAALVLRIPAGDPQSGLIWGPTGLPQEVSVLLWTAPATTVDKQPARAPRKTLQKRPK